MPNKADELRIEYARLVGRMRELNDAAEADERDLTAEDGAEYERIEQEATSLRGRIVREQDLRSRELGVDTDQIDPRELSEELVAQVDDSSELYATAFESYLRHGRGALDADQAKSLQRGFRAASDQNVGTPAAGGYLVPTEFRATLLEFLTIQNVMRQIPTTKIVTADGRNLQIPTLTDVGAAFLVAEATDTPHSDLEFGQVSISSHKYGRVVTVSLELLEDAAFDIAALVGQKIGGSIGALQGTHFMTGATPATMPQGILTAITSGSVALSATTIEADDFVDLYFSVTPPYRRNAVWVVDDSALAPLRKLKDSTGRYILDVAVGGGGVAGSTAVDTLLGKPVYMSPDMGSFGIATNKIAMFGDMSAYWIRDVGVAGVQPDETGGGGSFLVRRLEERYAEFGMVGFIGFHRTDGAYIGSPNAVKYLNHP